MIISYKSNSNLNKKDVVIPFELFKYFILFLI